MGALIPKGNTLTSSLMNSASFQSFIENNIPLSKAMQVKYLQISSHKIIIETPLQPNSNHKGTAFGGSQFAACALACYGLVWSLIEESQDPSQNIVIAESNIRYLRPVTKGFRVEVTLGDPLAAIQSWKLKGRLKLPLTAKIFENDMLCTEMTGLFIAKK